MFRSLEAAVSPPKGSGDLGALPQWRLEDLYEAMDSPGFAADLERAEGEARLFAETYQGKLIDAKGVKGRYIRFYSNGNTTNKLNDYIEVEVWGKPA